VKFTIRKLLIFTAIIALILGTVVRFNLRPEWSGNGLIGFRYAIADPSERGSFGDGYSSFGAFKIDEGGFQSYEWRRDGSGEWLGKIRPKWKFEFRRLSMFGIQPNPMTTHFYECEPEEYTRFINGGMFPPYSGLVTKHHKEAM
jgi:hypothetical protein